MARNSARKGVISVFGSGSVLYESSAYATAQELGRLIAEAGYKTQTGGYGGVMEAAARGAKQAGGDSIGCLLKKWPKGNPFLVESLVFDDIYDRLRTLLTASGFAIITDGGVGTFLEFTTYLWHLEKKWRDGEKRRLVIIKPAGENLGEWDQIMDPAVRLTSFENGDFIRRSSSPAKAVRWLLAK